MLVIAIPIFLLGVGIYSGVMDYLSDWVIVLLKGAIGLLVGVAIVVLMVGLSSLVFPTHYETDWQRDLIALQGKQSSEGSFFLGSGKVDGKMKYYYFYPTEDGYKLESVKASKSTLSYSDNPNIKKKQEHFNSKLLHWIVSPIAWGVKYHIEIPEGSIKREYVPMS